MIPIKRNLNDMEVSGKGKYVQSKLSMQLFQFPVSLEGINLTLVTENIIIKIENENIGQCYDCCGSFHCRFLGVDY